MCICVRVSVGECGSVGMQNGCYILLGLCVDNTLPGFVCVHNCITMVRFYLRTVV